MVEQRYTISSETIKTRSLEWCVPTPVPAHTFVTPIKSFTTAVTAFKKYRKGTLTYPTKKLWLIPYITILNNSQLKKESTIKINVFVNTRRSNLNIFGSKMLSK